MKGIPASNGIVSGPSTRDQKNVVGKILIVPQLQLKDVSSLKGLLGLILLKGSLLSHVAILAREKGIPCIMGVHEADLIPEGEMIQMDGETGLISPVMLKK